MMGRMCSYPGLVPVSRAKNKAPHPAHVVLVSLPGFSLWMLTLYSIAKVMQDGLDGDGAAGSEWPPFGVAALMFIGVPMVIGLSAACGVGVLNLRWPWRTRLLVCCVNLGAVLFVLAWFFASQLRESVG